MDVGLCCLPTILPFIAFFFASKMAFSMMPSILKARVLRCIFFQLPRRQTKLLCPQPRRTWMLRSLAGQGKSRLRRKVKLSSRGKFQKLWIKWQVKSLLVYLIAYQSHSLYVYTEPSSTILLMATQRKSCSLNLPMDPKASCYCSIKRPVVSVSLTPPSLHVSNPQDTVHSASYFPPANFEIPVSTRVYCGTEPSRAQIIPSQYHDGPNFNSQLEDNTLPLANNPCRSCGRYDPPSSSTGSLNMERAVDPYQFEQLLDPSTQPEAQYFNDGFIPQRILPYVSNPSSISPGDSYDIYAEITGSSESHLTMMSGNEEITLPIPIYESNNPHISYYM